MKQKTDVHFYARTGLRVRISLEVVINPLRTGRAAGRSRLFRRVLFCDNGSEFTSQAMDLWAENAHTTRDQGSRDESLTSKAAISPTVSTLLSTKSAQLTWSENAA